MVTYAAAIIGAAVLLWIYGQFDGMPLMLCLQQIIVLGFGAALGASAGRFLLQ